MKRLLVGAAIILAASMMLFVATPSAVAEAATCSGALGGKAQQTNVSGNVVVPNGASCTLSFVNITGSVQVGRGATLLINGYSEPSTISGNVEAQGCSSALLEGNIAINGSVDVSGCIGGGPNGFQGPDVVINGNFRCEGNSSGSTPCLAWLGRVKGNVQIAHNMSATPADVSLTDIGGQLTCEANQQTPTHVHGPDWVAGTASVPDQCAGFSTTATSTANGAVTPVASCGALASLPASAFPVPNTVITSATLSSDNLPQRCIINGVVDQHVSPFDNCTYLDGFQVQLPIPTAWNGRFMFEGGGGTEGAVPTATGTDSGSAGSNFGILNGYAVVSQDGGHENSLLSQCGQPSTEFYLDPWGLAANGLQSIEVAAINAKFLIDQFYGRGPDRSYWVGCSEGGRQGMVMSEVFPSFFDGIVAGDPVYDVEAVNLSEIWSVQQIQNAYTADETALSLPPLQFISGTPPLPAQEPILNPAFPIADQTLFESALQQTCDPLDGVTDGIIDDLPACVARFNPATATYTDFVGVLGPANTTYRLQCTGAKNPTCLTAAQIQAAIAISQGPRVHGSVIHDPAGAVAPDHVTNTPFGYVFDGGFMTTVGTPSRNIGSPTGAPGNEGQFDQLPSAELTPPNPAFDPNNFDFNADLGMLTAATPKIEFSTSLDIRRFVNYGHKIIWYHGVSDPGPPVVGTVTYYNEMAQQNGGLQAAQGFSRFYPVPNMDHCTGGATTDQFDMLTPVVNWVEHNSAPGPVTATGVDFNATTFQVVGDYLTNPNAFVKAPTTRARPLCPYPQQARFIGATTRVDGIPVAANPADLDNASKYRCVQVPPNDQFR